MTFLKLLTLNFDSCDWRIRQNGLLICCIKKISSSQFNLNYPCSSSYLRLLEYDKIK